MVAALGWPEALQIKSCMFTRRSRSQRRGQLLDLGTASPPGRAGALMTKLLFALLPPYQLGHAGRVSLNQIVMCEASAAI